MPTLSPSIRAAALLLAAAAVTAQTPIQPPPNATPHKPRPTQPPFNPNVIFLDPAHGGSDPGAHLADDALEKDATLAFAKLLRTLLTPKGFTVILTHESAAIPTPPPPPQPDADGNLPPATPFNPAANNPSLDARTEQANRSRAVACILIHASNGGHGVHLYTSSLAPAPPPDPTLDPALRPLVPWDAAQAPVIAQSSNLASTFATAINGVRLPLVTAHASIRPIDSMTCPAVAVELAPLTSADTQTSPADPEYQQRVAQALAAALDTWRSQAQAQIAAQAAAQAAAAGQLSTGGQPTNPQTPKPKPKPKPVPIPQEGPTTLNPDSQRPPAPVIRRSPTSPAPPPGATP